MSTLIDSPPRLAPEQRKALMQRHDAAMRIVKRLPVAQRPALLLAVVSPSDPRLRSCSSTASS